MISIGPGGYHTIALSLSGRVYVWGHNRVGQLGFYKEELNIFNDFYDSDGDSDYDDGNKYYYKEPILLNSVSNILI